jgi:actin-related protein 2
MVEINNKDTIIADNGTGYFKCGYAGDNFPRWSIPSIVGTPEFRAGEASEIELRDKMVGDEAHEVAAHLDIKYPLANGRVNDWELLEDLWAYTFEKKFKFGNKGYDAAGKNVFCTETAGNPKKDRELWGQLIFEKFGFAGCAFKVQAILALASEGKQSGLVFDSGDGASQVIPVVDGAIM